MYGRVALLLVLTGCFADELVQHRAALVPHQTPIATTGQPQTTFAKFAVGAPVLDDMTRPMSGQSPPPGIAVPSRHLRGALSFSPTDNFSFSLIHEQGLRSSSTDISQSLPELPDHNVTGYGLGLSYSIETSTPGLRVGLATELMSWHSPWIAYTSDTSTGYTVVDHGTDTVSTFGGAITPSYRNGDLVVYGGVTFRNHPTLDEKVTQYGVASPPEVEGGTPNLTFAGGLAYEYEGFEVGVDMFQTVTEAPVAYGPSIGVWVAIGGGEKPSRRAPAPVVKTPPAPGPRITRRERAWRLTQQAAAAARADRCDTVKRLDRDVFEIDADFHASVFVRDVAIARCLGQ